MRELNAELDAKLAHFDDLFAAIDAGEDTDDGDPHDELHEAPLEIKKALIVVLTTGGPHVEAQMELNADGSISGASLYGYWGGQRSSRAVPEGSGMWRALESYVEVA